METAGETPSAPGQLRVLVLAAQRDLHRLLAEALHPLRVSPAQAEVLSVLAAHPSVSLQALGERLVCETGSPSRLVQGLVRAGLVARASTAGDARQVALSLTAAGAERAAAVTALEAEFQEELGSLLADAPTDAVIAALARMVALLPSGRALRLRYGSLPGGPPQA